MAAMKSAEQRAAIIVRQCPATAEGYMRYKIHSFMRFFNRAFQGIASGPLEISGCQNTGQDALIRPTKGSSSQLPHNGGNRLVVNTKHNTSGLSGNTCPLGMRCRARPSI
jgi:hypothetical protein